ncbi:hypothetical protein [Longispora albida]|uniref:hypothetical protein n=1 Tax=Longispora albida TaxID=203523 RepID=UPI00037031DF|nr:hypothetical protein [Longispora albida]
MIWLTWRQFRVQAGIVFGALVVLAAALAVTGPGVASDYRAGMATCGDQSACQKFAQQFLDDHSTPYVGIGLVVVLLPALIGLFWGAPLVTREFEAGTHRLVWNQSITRTRWLAVKLGVVGLAAMAAAGLASAAVTWWSSPLDKASAGEVARLSPVLFMTRDLAPIGYAAFAFVLGAAVGILVRRTMPAIALTLAAFAVVQLVMPLAVRPHLLEPVDTTIEITESVIDGLSITDDMRVTVTVQLPDKAAWLLANETVDAKGNPAVMPAAVGKACLPPIPPDPDSRGVPAGCVATMKELGYRQHVSYHPGDRYWSFQWAELGIYLALSSALAGFAFWRISRRRPS